MTELERIHVQSLGPDVLQTSATPAGRTGVLVVDDDEAVLGLLNTGLRQLGFSVWQAASGQEAVDLYKRHQADIEIVLLDVRMPGSLDGPQTLAALRELEPNVLCCFMSGQFGGYTEAGLRELGASRVIPKPFRLFEVAHVLRDLARTADLSRSGV